VAEVIRKGTDEIFAPVAGSTLTTVVVFTPLGLLQGVVGQFFKSFSLALSIAVLLSLLIAMALIPLLAGEWLRRRPEALRQEPRFRLSLKPVARAHEHLLGWLQRRRAAALLTAAGAAVLLFFLARTIGTGFMPDMDEGGFIFDYWAPTGASLKETDRLIGQIERVLKADPAIQSFTRRTGSELGFFATSPSRGDLTVLLKPRCQRHGASVYDVMSRVREQVETEVPSVRVELIQILQDLIGDLAGNPQPVEIKLFHPDLATAERASAAVAEAIDSVPGLADLFNGVAGYLPELRVDLDPLKVSRLGLTSLAAAEEARAVMF